MPRKAVGDFEIHFAESAGQEPAIVLVHSSGLDHRQWGSLRLLLPSGRRVLAVDLPGSGKSTPWTKGAPFTLEQDIDAVAAVLDEVSEPAVLVGHSYGGFLALKAALRAPEKVAAILVHEPVVWGVFYSAGADQLIAEAERVDEDGRFLDAAHGGLEPWWRRFVEVWGGPGAWDALPAERRRAFLAVGPKVFEEVRALCLDRTPHTDYARLTCPVVITVGDGTQPLERDACEILAGAVLGSRLVAVPGGHMGPISAPAAFAAQLVALIETLSPSGQ